MITVDRKLLEDCAKYIPRPFGVLSDTNVEIVALRKRIDAALSEPQEKHKQTDRCGFDRNASHSEGRYVCLCESTIAPQGGTPETDEGISYIDGLIEVADVDVSRSLERRLHAANERIKVLEKDAKYFTWYFSGDRSSSKQIIELNLRVISGDMPTLGEWRAAIDAEIDK